MRAVASANHRGDIDKGSERVYERVMAALKDERAIVVVRAPPGSGKTYLLTRVGCALWKKKRRVGIAAQTNAQADDICRRLAVEPWKVLAYRFVRKGGGMDSSVPGVIVVDDFNDLPRGPCVVVGTSSKWGSVEIRAPFDVLLVDEAWQMQWSQFVPLGRIASRFVLIGDPGQIPPVVAIDASRWETAQSPPHWPAPEIVCSKRDIYPGLRLVELQLPASRRLPSDAVSLLQPFYDFPFGAWALPAERAVLAARSGTGPLDRAINLLADGSVVAVTIPTVDDLPPSDMDAEVAELAVDVAARLLHRKARVRLLDECNGKSERRLSASEIGITATHRVMNELIAQRLRRSRELQDIRVDTPERWQGLQLLVTIAVHPLSGVLQPSAFDLETGRLCVMASRHQGGLIVVGRDHIGDTLESVIVVADQAIGRPDVAGRGHQQHLAFWNSLEARKRIARL